MIQLLRDYARATIAIALPSTALLPGALGMATALSLVPVDRAMADTVCFKTNTELDFINKTDMQNSRDKLENPAYFGPGGAAAPETFDFAGVPTVTEAALVGAGCDIFIGGGFEGSLSTTEGAALVDWSQGARDVMVIGGCDLDTANETCLAFGRTLTDIGNGGVLLNQTLAYNPLTCGGADAVATFGGRSTYIGLGPSGTDITLASHNTVGSEPAATTDSLVTPSLLMTADADMFGSSGSGPIGSGPTATSNQAIFVLNVFKFALDGIHGRLGNPQCVESYNDRADLELTMSAPPAYMIVGERFVLDTQVTNTSALSVGSVAAAITIPAGFTIVSTSGPGSYDAGTGRWTIGTMAPAEVQTLQLTLEATAFGTAGFAAEIVGSSLPDTDSAPNSSFADDDLADGLPDDDEAQGSTLVAAFDRSDALTGGDAVHEIVTGLFMGAGLPDSDEAGLNDGTATGDDLNGSDDEDGVTIPALTRGETGIISVAVTGPGYLQAWMDFDGNGTFDSIEQIARDVTDADGDGVIALSVAVPSGATTAQTFARFRWSTDFGIEATGYAPDGEVEDYAVTFGTDGPILAGRVFLDNGAGGATAHDGLIEGIEAGTINATVTLRDGGGAVLATPTIGPDGAWSHALPSTYAGNVTVAVASDALRIVAERDAGLPGLTNADPRDGTYSFTPATGQSYTTLDTGLIAPPTLDADNTVTIAPGQTVALRHRYEATTAGTVTIEYIDTVAVPATGFSGGLFTDPACDGNAGTAISGAIAVTAGETLCLVSRITASGGVSPGASMTYTLRARTALSNLPLSLDATDVDALTVGSGTDVVLVKTVRNITKSSAEGLSNTGDLGDILEYRITVRNPGVDTATDIVVQDTTPAYTSLSEAIPSPVALSPEVVCAVLSPAPNTAGYAGPIAWGCTGGLLPGGDGAISFRVRIDP